MLLSAGPTQAHAHDHTLADLSRVTLSVPETAAAVSVHVAAMLFVMGAVALLVYRKLGLAILRRAWINSDHVWAAAFVMAGAITLIT